MTRVLRLCLSLSFLTMLLPVWSQTPLHPDGVGARFLLLDHYTPNIYDQAEPQQISNGIELAYHRNVGWKYLNIVLPMKFAVAKFPNAQQDIRFTSLDLLPPGFVFRPGPVCLSLLFCRWRIGAGGLCRIQYPIPAGSRIESSAGPGYLPQPSG